MQFYIMQSLNNLTFDNISLPIWIIINFFSRGGYLLFYIFYLQEDISIKLGNFSNSILTK